MLMHAIGTSLAFWIYTIVRETQDAINMKYYGELDQSKLSNVPRQVVKVESYKI